MAEEPTVTSPTVEDTITAPTSGEAPASAPVSTNGVGSTDDHATNGDETKVTAEDIEAAGPQATTDVNPPDGEGKAEVDVVAAAAAGDAETPAFKSGKRKSSAGVPEHKTKKLNKKKSQLQLNLDVQPGDHYWARLKGYPPWPAIICDEKILPATLAGNRPVSTKRPDGTYREDYLEGGKNARDRTYPIMFLATNEFAWMVNTALTKLEPSECTFKEGDKKMTKDLREAYKLAGEEHDLDYYKDIIRQHQEQLKEEAEEKARKDAEKVEAAEKKAEKAKANEGKEKRKSKAAVDEEVEGDSADAEAKPSKKRKKGVESEGEDSKPKKTPKSLKIAGPKTPASTAKKAAKTKKVVTKPDEQDDEVKAEAPLTEAEKLQRREKAVLYLRHRLQKGFLSRDLPPKEEEMAGMAEFLTQLESYADLEPSIIRTTKIHKVLKAIVKLTSIPKEEEYHFKKRSSDLLGAWTRAMDSDEAPASAVADGPTTNGDSRAETPTKAEETTKEPSAAPVEVSNPGNGAVDEADITMADASAVEAEADEPSAVQENGEPEKAAA